MRKTAIAIGALLLCVATIPGTYAADGKDVFVDKCGACHKAGGGAAAFAPTLYASVQWERFFAKNKHAALQDIKSRISEADLKAIQAYLVKHAADSDQPEAAGLMKKDY